MCQRLLCQKREFSARSSSCEVLCCKVYSSEVQSMTFCENRHEASYVVICLAIRNPRVIDDLCSQLLFINAIMVVMQPLGFLRWEEVGNSYNLLK